MPAFDCALKHLPAAFNAPRKNLVPDLSISFTQSARSWPEPWKGSVVAPCVWALTRSATTPCCDSMQLEIVPSSVRLAED